MMILSTVPPHTDTNLQTKTQEKHWKEVTSASSIMLGRLHIVLLVSDKINTILYLDYVINVEN